MDFDKAYDKLSWVRGQLESTVSNSRVELMPSDMGDFFITVTQRNETTGNDNTWSFCVNVDDNYVQMLEPTEDEEKFTNITEVYSIIKSFLQGGMSREKRRNMPEYNPGEPIKITGKGNKIGSSNKTVIRQGPNLKTLDETPSEHIMKNLDAYKGYTRYDMEQLVLNPSGYTLFNGNNREAVYKKDGAEDITLLFRNGELKDAKITSSRKPIKSDYSDEEYWYPETKKVYRLYKYNSNGDYYTWDYDTLEEAQRMKPRGNRYTTYNIEEVEVPVQSSHKPIKSSLSDVNKALGFTDNDIEEDGKIHITTDFGEFVVDYVNDEYIVSYDGEERIFTEYKDTVEEVVDLFNKLCDEEVEFFDKNINSSKSIKSGYVIKVTETDNDNTYSPTYVNGDSWQSKEPQIFETEEDAQEQAEDFRKYLDKRLRSLGGRWQYKLEIVKSSRKPIKSAYDKETLKKVIRAYLDKMGYKDVEGGVDAAADYIWQNEDYYTDYDLHSKVKQWFKETKENYPETLIKASRVIKSVVDPQIDELERRAHYALPYDNEITILNRDDKLVIKVALKDDIKRIRGEQAAYVIFAKLQGDNKFMQMLDNLVHNDKEVVCIVYDPDTNERIASINF